MPPKQGNFSGELGLVSVFDIGQLLSMNSATGRLALTRDDRRGVLFFENGQIVNAVDEGQVEGIEVAYRLFAYKTGTFEFKPEGATGRRLIQGNTESIMLEAARHIDEEGGAEEGQPLLSDALKERQGSMDALRDAFSQLQSEAKGSAARARISSGSPIDALTAADDRLIYRRGRPPRLCCGGQWVSASETAIQSHEYDDLRKQIYENADPLHGAPVAGDPGTGGIESRVARLVDGRAFAVTVVGSGLEESMWIRRVSLPAPEPGRLTGPNDLLQKLIEISHGRLLVVAPLAPAATELLHAVVAMAMRRTPGAALVVAEPGTFRHDDESGVFAEVPANGAAHALRTLKPSLCAIEPGVTLDRATWSALDEAGIVLMALAAEDAEDAVERYHHLVTQAGAVGVTEPDGLLSRSDAAGSDSIRYAARRLGAMPVPVPVKKPAAAATPKAA
ncbi:MAG: DUF4388 domain-containing protein [Candidatus Eiseniibacteriota bacterium]